MTEDDAQDPEHPAGETPGAADPPIDDGDLDIDSSGIQLSEDTDEDLDSASQMPVPDAVAAEGEEGDAPPAPAQAAKPGAEAKPPKKDRGTRRVEKLQADIDRLTATKSKTASEVRQLEDRKRELEAATGQPAKPATETAKVDATLPAKPKWNGGAGWDDDFDKFTDALDAWNDARFAKIRAEVSAEAETRARDHVKQERLQADRTNAVNKMYERMERGRKKYPDWDAAHDALNEFPISTDLSKPDFVRDLIMHSEHGDEIAYHLGKHPDDADALINELTVDYEDGTRGTLLTNSMMDVLLDSTSPVALLAHLARHLEETRELAMLSPRKALRLLTRLDDRLSAGANSGSPAKPKPVSSAPPPPSRRAGSRSASDRSPESESVDAYLDRREREELAKLQGRSA